MTEFADIVNGLPHMLSGEELINALQTLPAYNPEVSKRRMPQHV